MRKWRLEKRLIDSLVPHDRNPRSLTKEEAKQLKKSIKQFGVIDKPVITNEGVIIGGHQRINVLREMKLKHVECWICDDETMTAEEIDELNIRLNKNTGSWDWDKLANEWDVNLLCEWGFDPEEFEDPLPKESKPRVVIDFEDSEALEESLKYVEQIAANGKAKIKVKK